VKERFDIVIAGAGMMGLTAAALLARSACAGQLRLTIVDAGKPPKFDVAGDIDLRVSAISPGSAQLLGDAGVWPGIRSLRACPFVSMRVWDADGSVDGAETLRFDAADLAVPELGCIVENTLVQDRLLQAIADRGQSVRFATRIQALHAAGDRFLVRLGDGTVLRPELLIGADGNQSFVRDEAGIKVRSWPYPQSAFVVHVRPEKPHRNTAWQRFLRSGPLALLPLTDGRVSVVWSTSTEETKRALEAPDDELGRMLGEASDGVLGKLTPGGRRGAFPLHAQFARRYTMPGLVLVGDAAHSVHPLAGQGANLGFADVAALIKQIEEALAHGEHPGDLPVLRRYERARKGANQLMLGFVDGVSRLFGSDLASVARLRGTGMRLFNRSGPIRRQVLQVALGLRR
jgi:2-octaprenylphenol hydroxylase